VGVRPISCYAAPARAIPGRLPGGLLCGKAPGIHLVGALVNKLNSILGGAVVIAIGIVFIVQFRPASGQQGNPDAGPKCVAEVKGSCVNSNYFFAAQRLISYRGIDAARQKSMGFRRQVAEGLIDQWALNQDAKRLGVTVSDDDVSAEIAAGRAHISLPADKAREMGYPLGIGEDQVSPIAVRDRKTKKFDAKQAEKNIRQTTRLSSLEFREYQKLELTAARMRDIVKQRVRVGETEAFEQFAREKATVTLDFARLDRRFYADLVLDTSPGVVQAWADKNKDELDKVWESRKAQFLPECRVTRHVLVKIGETASDDEKAEARKKAERLLERITKGEDFADVARKTSDDGSAVRGGELGCVQKGKMVKPFEDAMLALGEGKMSGVVQSEFGFHILKVDRIVKDADAEKIGRLQTATEVYISHESERLASEGAKKILEAVRGGKSLKDALQTHLDEILPKVAEPKKKADAKADAKDDTKKGEAPSDDKPAVTAENHPARPTIEATMPFNSSGDPIQGVRPGSEVAHLAFSLEKPGAVPNDIVPLETGYAVLQLKEKTPASKEEWEKNREFYVSAMRGAKQNDALIAYVKKLRSQVVGDPKFPEPSMLVDPSNKDDAPSGPENDEQ
jgi:peptidyl-prolyl cis-trans isomerase D